MKENAFQRILAHPVKKVKYMVTGHPRSGTRWLSQVLWRCGLDMPHETPGADGIVSWQHGVPGTYAVKCDTVIQLVRFPLDCIASTAYTLHASAFPFMRNYIGLPIVDNNLIVAMWTWYHWNLMLEDRCIDRFRLEKIYPELPRLLKHFNTEKPEGIQFPIRANIKRHLPTTWKELDSLDKGLANKCREMGARYGYRIDS